MAARRQRPMFLIDIAVPRNFDPAIASLADCCLYDIDDLRGVVAANRYEREREVVQAERIVAEEVVRMSDWLAGLEVVPTIARLRGAVDGIREAELARLDSRLARLHEPELRAEVEQLTAAIVNKILHVPTVRLKELAAERDAYVYVDALQRLFDLGDAAPAPACEGGRRGAERLVALEGGGQTESPTTLPGANGRTAPPPAVRGRAARPGAAGPAGDEPAPVAQPVRAAFGQGTDRPVSAARVVIGSRASTLALVQAETVAGVLRAAHPGLEVTIVTMATTGDRILDSPLAQIGDKGLFTKELESALLAGRIDCAVHSAKDLPTTLPAGCAIGAFTARHDPRDVFVAGAAAGAPAGLAALRGGARIGSSSLRRRSQLLALRPDLALLDLRGNVETRLRKVAQQGLDGTVLAAAGLARLGRPGLAAFAFSFAEMLPAVGQGALAVEARAGDEPTAALLACLHDEPSALAVRAERALLGALQGGCQIPIGAHAELRGAGRGGASGGAPADAAGPRDPSELVLRAFVGSLDGTDAVRDSLAGPPSAPEALGRALAERLRARRRRAHPGGGARCRRPRAGERPVTAPHAPEAGGRAEPQAAATPAGAAGPAGGRPRRAGRAAAALRGAAWS